MKDLLTIADLTRDDFEMLLARIANRISWRAKSSPFTSPGHRRARGFRSKRRSTGWAAPRWR
jgi:hypothetical protein